MQTCATHLSPDPIPRLVRGVTRHCIPRRPFLEAKPLRSLIELITFEHNTLREAKPLHTSIELIEYSHALLPSKPQHSVTAAAPPPLPPPLQQLAGAGAALFAC
eukprot:1153702-Pelagomonas_calceolata.AAC.16